MVKRSTKTAAKATRPRWAHQFLVVLAGSDPLIWRRIQVPESATYWDLHVAIQDAMGWQDCHLHEFTIRSPAADCAMVVGLPSDEDYDARQVKSWDRCVADDFGPGQEGLAARYLYDFGDDWAHGLVFEGSQPVDIPFRYARCLGGARRCPPEDCGGMSGYEDLLDALANPRHPEHDELREWVPAGFDPEAFDKRAVKFTDPGRRLRNLSRE